MNHHHDARDGEKSDAQLVARAGRRLVDSQFSQVVQPHELERERMR